MLIICVREIKVLRKEYVIVWNNKMIDRVLERFECIKSYSIVKYFVDGNC